MALIDRIRGMATGKKVLFAVIAAALLITVAGLIIYFATQGYYANTMRLLRIEGTVNIEDSKGGSKPVIDNIRFQSGDALNTGSDGLASVGLDDTKIVTLQNDSRAEFQKKMKKLELKLTKGALFFEVTEKLQSDESFEIKTSNMTAGIRGTSGYVFYDDDGREALVITDGKVIVNAYNPETGETKSVEVLAGQKIKVYLYSDSTDERDSVEFFLDNLEEDEIPGFCLRMLKENEKLLEKVCQDTGWDKDKILDLVDRLLNPDKYPEVTATPTPAEEEEPTPTPTASPTQDPEVSITPTPSVSITPTGTPPPTATPVPGNVTSTPTPTPDPEATATPTPEATPTVTPTDKPTATPTDEPEATVTATATPTAKVTPTATPTAKPDPTAAPTPVPTPTPTAKPTATPVPGPTDTPTATPTDKPTATPTSKVDATATPTAKATPSSKPTATPTSKPTATPTSKPTATPTSKPTPTSTTEPSDVDEPSLETGCIKGPWGMVYEDHRVYIMISEDGDESYYYGWLDEWVPLELIETSDGIEYKYWDEEENEQTYYRE